MKKIFMGPTGSGKSSSLFARYQEIAEQKGTHSCLVFLKSDSDVTGWRTELELGIMGPLHIYTYIGFVQKEVADYWPELEKSLSGRWSRIEPIFMNVEMAHFIMTQFVAKRRQQLDVLEEVTATNPQLAVQLIDNLNQGVFNGLSLEEIKERLFTWAGDDRGKLDIFNQAADIMKVFRDFCRSRHLIDYSLSVELYNKFLLADDSYVEDLHGRFPYLFVDDLEKTVPAAQNLFVKLLKQGSASFFAFNPQGGFNRFFGANPELARETFFSHCQLEKLEHSYTASRAAVKLATNLSRIIRGESQKVDQASFPMLKGILETEYRGEMLAAVANRVVALLSDSDSETQDLREIAPEEVAIIVPEMDKVVQFTLGYYLKQNGFSVNNLTASRRLVDFPLTQALITITLLVKPEVEMEITFSSLQQTLGLLLELDPLRSSRLAEMTVSSQYSLPEIADGDGFSFVDLKKYNYLRNWLNKKKQQSLELAELFHSIFSELLLPLSPSAREVGACQRLQASLSNFTEVVLAFKEVDRRELIELFFSMLQQGTLAAKTLFQKEVETEGDRGVILGTPYKFLYSDIESVDYIFWLDISSNSWLRSAGKELTNPHIFTPGWDGKWDDDYDRQLRKKQLTEYIQSILGKCQQGLFLADSYLNSMGWEQEGPLYEWVLELAGGEDVD